MERTVQIPQVLRRFLERGGPWAAAALALTTVWLWGAPSAHAACPNVIGELSCSSTVSGSIDLLADSDIDGPYSCGTPYAPLNQLAAEDIYTFSCQDDGLVTLLITNLGCDLDMYILNNQCNTSGGCVAGSTAASTTSDSVTFTCQKNTSYSVVIEAYGAQFANGPGACKFVGDATYTLEFDVSQGTGCPEDCDDGGDNDLDGDVDCADSDCTGDPVCFMCPDADGDGFADASCGGTDCRDDVSAINPGATEVCDGVDNDCNPSTGDGSGEAWFDTNCDGNDADQCDEGFWACQSGMQVCGDTSGDNLEVCDGVDNDCSAATPDGAHEVWLGDDCDGTDGDLCDEGTYFCSNGSQSCNDASGNTPDFCDGIDNDCNPATPDGSAESWYGDNCDGLDADLCQEGDFTCAAGSQVCDDTSGDNVEVCNGMDDDCDPSTPDGLDEAWLDDPCDGTDDDLCDEGTFVCSSGSQACTDTSGDNFEFCDNADNDCNAATADGVDETWYGDGCDGADTDLCQEGSFACTGGAQQCTDTSGDSLDVCDGNDNDCNPATSDGADEAWLGTTCDGTDNDQCLEGTFICQAAMQQCTDATGDITELCNGSDDNCDGVIDEGCVCTAGEQQGCYSGTPGTAGIGECVAGTQTCDQFGVWGPCQGEVVDVAETCDNKDNDCDNVVDQITSPCYNGPAGTQGVGICQGGTETCTGGVWGACVGEVTPGTELCNGADDDCNPMTADGSAETWFGDTCDGIDSDLCTEGTLLCAAGSQTCTDTSGDNVEICDTIDNDCDGQFDEGVATTFFADTDGDGFGDPASPTQACVRPMGYVSNNTDCLDTSNIVFPGATELCDTLDNDCNAATADGAQASWLGNPCDGADADLCEEGALSCVGGGQVCGDDSNDSTEVCDGIDNDCDGLVDVDDPDLVDPDNDNDGVIACLDCDDTDGSNFPGNAETCDGLDNDCDGLPGADEIDGDGDGQLACAGDCDDTDDTIYTGADEVCDGLDNNCDLLVPKDELTTLHDQLLCEFTGDPDGDFDADGLTNSQEIQLGTDPTNADTDGDGLTDFAETDNGTAIDADNDFIIDALDPDDDNDGIPTAREKADADALGNANPDGDQLPSWHDFDSDDDGVSDMDEAGADPTSPVDTDDDGTPDYLDLDSDDDTVADDVDNCRLVPNTDQADTDGNGVGDACAEETCDNGLDDNGDGMVDCIDPLCTDALVCVPEVCDDGDDNNGDGLADCDDPDCAGGDICQPDPELCDNGIDDDGDGMTDCDDPVCAVNPACDVTLDDPEVGSDVSRLDGGLEVDDNTSGAQSDCCTAVRARDENRRDPAPLAALVLVLLGLVGLRRRRHR